jgi:hypothetical protein
MRCCVGVGLNAGSASTNDERTGNSAGEFVEVDDAVEGAVEEFAPCEARRSAGAPSGGVRPADVCEEGEDLRRLEHGRPHGDLGGAEMAGDGDVGAGWSFCGCQCKSRCRRVGICCGRECHHQNGQQHRRCGEKEAPRGLQRQAALTVTSIHAHTVTPRRSARPNYRISAGWDVRHRGRVGRWRGATRP